jgi:DNA repair protein RadC
MPRHYRTASETITHYARAAAQLEATPTLDREEMTSPETVAAFLATFLADADREHAVSLTLDTKHRPLAVNIISTGSLANTFMVPRDILRDAIIQNAAAIIVAHNHPSGDPKPSRDDERITQRLNEAAKIIGIELLDALVIGTGGAFTSLARHGTL